MRHDKYDRTEYEDELKEKNAYNPESKTKAVPKPPGGQRTLGGLAEKYPISQSAPR